LSIVILEGDNPHHLAQCCHTAIIQKGDFYITKSNAQSKKQVFRKSHANLVSELNKNKNAVRTGKQP
jgi:hypothetical protein